MFAKVFHQIFNSSIAEDYNCRRMFMDLLVLADPTGAVDMTLEAVARVTNVPIEEVRRYINELSQPDAKSRSQLEEGKRLTPLDPNRDWGWQIVNYLHYRKLIDSEALRAYFREAQRKTRAKKKLQLSKTAFDTDGQSLTPPSSSSSTSVRSCTEQEAADFCESIGLPRSDGEAMVLHWQEKKWPKNWQLTIRKWKSFGYMPSQKKFRPKSEAPTMPTTWSDRKALRQTIDEVQERKNELFKLRQRENRNFTAQEQRRYSQLDEQLKKLKSL